MGKTLYEHATDELRRLGLHLPDESPDSRKILVDTLALVRRFEKQNHNEHTGKWVLEFFETICNFLPLSPITDDPAEWEGYEDTHKNIKTGEAEVTKRWQNLRAPSIISMDGGKTFVDLRTNKEGTSVDHVEQAKEWAADRAKREASRLEGDQPADGPAAPNVLAKPPVDTSAPAGEEGPTAAPRSEERKAADKVLKSQHKNSKPEKEAK